MQIEFYDTVFARTIINPNVNLVFCRPSLEMFEIRGFILLNAYKRFICGS